MNDLLEMGFEIRENGPSGFLVDAIPLELSNIHLGMFFHDILGEVKSFRSIKLEEILKDKLASAACKAAVRGGMDLTQTEVETLFAKMDGNMVLKCPHGRPVVARMTKVQIEKLFKRIL